MAKRGTRKAAQRSAVDTPPPSDAPHSEPVLRAGSSERAMRANGSRATAQQTAFASNRSAAAMAHRRRVAFVEESSIARWIDSRQLAPSSLPLAQSQSVLGPERAVFEPCL